VDERVEVRLRITLDRTGLGSRLRRPIENDFAFFVLGLVYGQLAAQFGDENCRVEMESATGIEPGLARAMNDFARRHKQALDTLDRSGEVTVADRDVVEVFQTLHDVIITQVGSSWRIVRNRPGGCM
jgi:hypothetical protein